MSIQAEFRIGPGLVAFTIQFSLLLGQAVLFAGGTLAPLGPGVFARWNPLQPVIIATDQGPMGVGPPADWNLC